MRPAATNLSLVHLTQEPAQQSPSLRPLLLLLHGVGSHEHDLMGLAPHLDKRFFIVSARAPLMLAPGSYAWFHVDFTPRGPVIVPEEAERSRVTVLRFLDELVAEYHVDPRRRYLMGFSQGAIMSLSIVLTHPRAVAGAVAMSGRILPEVLPLMAEYSEFSALPVFVAHGLHDPVLPIHYGRDARVRLSALPVELTYREYAMAHQVSQESLTDIAGWLKDRLDREPV